MRFKDGRLHGTQIKIFKNGKKSMARFHTGDLNFEKMYEQG